MGKSNIDLLGMYWVFYIPLPQKFLLIFYLFIINQMEQNLFSECFTNKKTKIKVKTIQKYALQCEKITW